MNFSTTELSNVALADGVIDALNKIQALIVFDLSGHVTEVNDVFLDVMGYARDELVGKHHRLLCEPAYTHSSAYTAFWETLRSGQAHTGEFMRLTKDARTVWLQASYSPLHDACGKVIGVIKFATDVTAAKIAHADMAGRVQAINRVQAVVEFDLTGKVLAANENFLRTFGYSLDEVVGQHHRLFCEAAFVRSPEYSGFWERLGRGEFNVGEYCRLSKDGRPVWIQASYNPLLDASGKPFKVVKFATDVTRERLVTNEAHFKLEAIGRSQAVIEFDMRGNILDANANFLQVMGYTAAEVRGQHHAIFCKREYVKSCDYRDFWADLNDGRFKAGRFRRQGKDGADVWIQATYNPILGSDGKPYKVVKFAMDITAQVNREHSIAGNVADIARVMDSLSGSIGSIAEGSRHSTHLAGRTQREADDGSNLLRRSRDSIIAIQSSTQSITKISDAINEVAGHTHLLAFNAAVEAARAGEQGIAFSVVAEEVRRLAEKSASATREISRLIEEIVLRVDEGGRLSEQIQESFSRIQSSVNDTTASINHIHDATTKQVAGTQNVTGLLIDLQISSHSA